MTWQIHRGDALAVLPTIPNGSVDLVLADPPYNSGGRTAGERVGSTARDKYVSTDAGHTLADFAGDNRDQRSYTYWLSLILSECLRIARPGASCLVFCDWRQAPATSDALQVAGWTWRGIIPWRKPISRPQRDGFKRECEYVLWASHGTPVRHETPIYLPGLVEGSQPRGAARVHITQKPVGILRQLIRVCPAGGTVLDPFAGSGSAGVAAIEGGRSYIGIENTAHYAEVARGRLAQAAKETSA
ncbi:site-specific DNA-methyltransferase (adenine-specific) [Sinosporangium album]|uniref:Methyltransferase n=1 Tax=Sinosporangium album TaxID=504805 RepID=A0A1G8L4B7_9ACTN|nr:site-specific DNA-methyltransferase [Sinosporangium album]SDI50553.1 site-specific DNA-methyltransferase (adenine-specific) [Sinosporangium album]